MSYELFYNHPAREWKEALPLGSGRLGVTVWGSPEEDVLQLNEETLWDGGFDPEADNPDCAAHLPEIRAAIFSGDYAEGQRLTQKYMVCRGDGSHSGHGFGYRYGSFQTAGDILSGWLWFPDRTGRIMDYYVRQLWDSKGSVDLSRTDPEEFSGYCALCGWTLAHAHAKTGNRHKIAGYLGKGDAFPEAMQRFASSYADQNEADFAAFCKAVSGA